MGSYNYEALHKSTQIVKRAWIPDMPLTANRGYIDGNTMAFDQPYRTCYGNNYNNNALQDSLLLAQAAQAQVQMLGDRYASVYANGLHVRRPISRPQVREPRKQRKRRVREFVVREPVRELSTSQSPAQVPDATEEGPPLAGMIFGCTSETYMECMQMKLFALPAANKSEVMRVAPGTKLFLYNYQARELSGIFEATSHGDMDLEPDAFQGFFPAQVRMRCIEKYPNLPLKAFKEAMNENFEKKKNNKFKYSLDDVQVRKLVTLFRQELKYWKKQRARQESKIMASGFHPGLRPGYPRRNEVCYY